MKKEKPIKMDYINLPWVKQPVMVPREVANQWYSFLNDVYPYIKDKQ